MYEITFDADSLGKDPIGNALRLATGFTARQLLNEEVPVKVTARWTTSGNAVSGILTDQLDTTISIDGREIELADITTLTFEPAHEVQP